MTQPDVIMVSRTTERNCGHGVDRSGKVICDCFASALLAVLRDSYDDADGILNIVHDVDNSLATERLSS